MAESGEPRPPSNLERELAGDLPCVVCRYNLRGVSIRSVCPECGTAVRATILAVVDPHASELQPIRRPLLVVAGLLVWSGAALVGTVACWLPHVAAAWNMLASAGRGQVVLESRDIARAVAACVLVSGLGAIALVRPHAGLRRSSVGLAALAVLAYIPLAWVVATIDAGSTGAAASYVRAWTPDPERTRLRLVMGGLIVLIALGLRPNARVLVARSLALRSGRVDRQTLLALAVAAMVAAAGDAVALLSRQAGGGAGGKVEMLRLGAIALIAMGSALLTLGLAGAMVDCWRIGRAILRPGPTLGEVLGEGDGVRR